MIRQSTQRLICIKYLFILIAMFSSCSLLLACKVSSVDLYVGKTADANDIKNEGLTSVDIPVGDTAYFYAECEVTENPDSEDIHWEFDLNGDGYYDDGGDTTDANYVEFSAAFSEVGDCNIAVRAHIDNDYDSPGAVSNTCTVTAVGIEEVVGDPNNSGPLYTGVGATIGLKAIPDPNTAAFPDGEPTWKITSQPAGSDPNLSFSGEDATFSTDPNDPNAVGDYVIEATCGTSSDNITITVVEIDLDIWNGKTNGSGSPVADSNEVSTGAYLLVNWDDDDSNDVPDLYDPTVPGENDLSMISLSYGGLSVGTVELITDSNNISIWTDKTKVTEQTDLTWVLDATPPESPPAVLWVEGTGPSGSERDVELELKYTHAGNSTSDKVKATVVEIRLGNAVYRQADIPIFGDRGHTAIVYEFGGACTPTDFDDATNFKIIEMDGPTSNRTLATITEVESLPEYGCYTNTEDITYAKRLAIIKTAKALAADAANILFTADNALLCDPTTPPSTEENWDGTLTHIKALRCDGIIEVCYEYNDIDVWAMRRNFGGISFNYDISSQTDILDYDYFWNSWSAGANMEKDNLEEHNDTHADPFFWDRTLQPATQCGKKTPVNADTKFEYQRLCVPIGHNGGDEP